MTLVSSFSPFFAYRLSIRAMVRPRGRVLSAGPGLCGAMTSAIPLVGSARSSLDPIPLFPEVSDQVLGETRSIMFQSGPKPLLSVPSILTKQINLVGSAQ